MIPYPYNMVDMGGIDLAEANDTVVEGLYAKIVEAVNACGDVVLYNWKFANIEIAPQHTQILLGAGALTINTLIQVTEQDVVTVLGIAPPPPPVVPVEPLNVSENGVYNATPPASGFNPVTVAVPSKVLVPLSVAENGEYDPSDYDADGFNIVTVDVESPAEFKSAIRIWTQSTGGSDASINVQYGVFSDEFVPIGAAINIRYSSASQYTNYGIVDIQYSSLLWHVRAAVAVSYNNIIYNATQIVREWGYNTAIDMVIVEV